MTIFTALVVGYPTHFQMEDGGSESSNSSGGTASNRNNKAAAEKQTKLEDLDREELLKRCKNYLLLAQRAKAAKDGRCSVSFCFNTCFDANQML